MKKPENEKPKKEVFVTLILTESTSSLLNLNAPHLENTHPENSKICVITEADYAILKEQQKLINESSVNSSNNDLELASNIALFSTSNCSSNSEMYDITDDEDTKCSSETKLEGLLKKTKIVCHPLVTARSVAHSSKMALECNDLYVSLLDSESQLSSEFICRICHGGESMADLLTPCRCRGTVALAHLSCLERWLKESNHSSCELCKHHFSIVKEPRYSVPWSILVFLRHPGSHLREILLDLIAFAFYTPTAVASTYILMLTCESLIKNNIVTTGSFPSHIIAFSAVLGMATIDFTYTSWLIMNIQKHVEAWREWYALNSRLRVVLPKIKMKPHKNRRKK
ncbi:E3 ubiquitin-protein ligase MARCH3-like isoform X2 [Sitophilus oryzae]|uniref:E3 ubiquitin-protein ligase MARCH3-like isoform X2 n=1 Tax=Sitophilus oryzae TaxID=7048 RepID=A0A6J2YW98_SITOR|nr:E3 ubiquitin-protein ligase MARCH3-like isoform X2 [Sitophilus oryzae]